MNRFYLKDAPSSSSKRIFVDNADDNSSNTVTSSYTLNVFPNPATDVVNISMDNEELRVIRLLDMNGRILSESYDKGHFHSINVSDLDNGTYIIEIQGNEAHELKKFIKL